MKERNRPPGSVGIRVAGSSNIEIIGNTIKADYPIVIEQSTGLKISNNKLIATLKKGELGSGIPSLSEAQIAELVKAVQGAKGSRPEEAIKASKIGHWLKEQSFVEWANLAAAIVQLSS